MPKQKKMANVTFSIDSTSVISNFGLNFDEQNLPFYERSSISTVHPLTNDWLDDLMVVIKDQEVPDENKVHAIAQDNASGIFFSTKECVDGLKNWDELDPHDWNKSHLVSWTKHMAKKFHLDPEELNLKVFDRIDYVDHAFLTKEDFLNINLEFGEILYEAFNEVLEEFGDGSNELISAISSANEVFYGKPCELKTEELPNLAMLTNTKGNKDKSDFYIENMAHIDEDYVIDESVLPNSDLDRKVDLELEDLDSRNFFQTTIIDENVQTMKKIKESEEDDEDRLQFKPRDKRSAGGVRLWIFLRNLLHNAEFNPKLIKWEDYNNGVFRIVQSSEVAKLWGKFRKNDKMNYEKMSRAIRYNYHRPKTIISVKDKRLVYKFGPKASGWRTKKPIL